MDPNAETQLKSDAETARLDGVRPVVGKKPYSKPDILYLSPLEAMANVCTGTFAKISEFIPPICTVAGS